MIDEDYTEDKKHFEYLSKEIYENFNWINVHKAMIALGWFWSFGRDSFGEEIMSVPSLETIKRTAYLLLKQAYEEKKEKISTGGFSAGWVKGKLYLEFILEYWST